MQNTFGCGIVGGNNDKNLIAICCYGRSNIYGLISVVLSLNYNILNINNISKTTNINGLKYIVHFCKNLDNDDKTDIIFCFDGNDDEKIKFYNNYINFINSIEFLNNEQKHILNNIKGIINNKVNNISTGPNGAKNGVISYFINCSEYGDFSILHFIDDDDISATTKQIRINITTETYIYSDCYKTNPLKPDQYDEYENEDKPINIYGLHELYITKQFIKNIPLLRYGVMNKEDLDYRSRLFYINDSDDNFIDIKLYKYFKPTRNEQKAYKITDNDYMDSFYITNFMNYELDLAGKLKIEYKNKEIITTNDITYDIYAPVFDPNSTLMIGNCFINDINDKEKYVTYSYSISYNNKSNTVRDYRREKVHIPIRGNLDIINNKETNINKFEINNNINAKLISDEYLYKIVKKLDIPIYITRYQTHNLNMFAAIIKYREIIKNIPEPINLPDCTKIYDLLNTTFNYSMLYRDGHEETITYSYKLKQQNEKEYNKLTGSYSNIIDSIITKLKTLLIIFATILIIVIIILFIKTYNGYKQLL